MDCRAVCFSLFLRTRSSEFSGLGLCFRLTFSGVLGSSIASNVFVGAIVATISLAN